MHGQILRARRLALHHAPKAIETLAALMTDPDSRVRVAAAEGLLDRAGLRPFSLEPERVQVTAAVVDVDALRAELAQRLVRLAGLAEGPSVEALPCKPSALPSDNGQIEAEGPCR
jgi:HEAT repeat protein